MNTRPGMPDPHQLLELRGLIAGLCDAELTPSQVSRLEEMVTTSPACASYYVTAMSVYATLPEHVGVTRKSSGIKLISQWQSRDRDFWNDVVKTAAELENPLAYQKPQPALQVELAPRPSRTWRLPKIFGIPTQATWIALLCLTSSSLALLLGWMFISSGDQKPVPIAKQVQPLSAIVATLSKVRQLEWSSGQRPITTHSQLTAGERITIEAGAIEIRFESGAVVALQGPAEFELQSSNEGRLRRGRLVANVPAKAHGFVVQTPTVRVVDLGTRFGVDVDHDANASVHVLTGIVEAIPDVAGAKPIRLEANRAVQYDSASHSLRQVQVDRSRFEAIEARLQQPIVTAVEASSGKPYRIVSGGIHEDAKAYIDRDYEWNGIDGSGIPQELAGADCVLTSNNDDLDANFKLQITLSESADVYVLFDDRAHPPAWLTRDYVDTGSDLGLDTGIHADDFTKGPGRSVDVRFSLWKRHVGAGTITCGATNEPNVAHYGIAVVANKE